MLTKLLGLHSADGATTGLFPKKNNNTPPDMTCFTIISEPTEPGRLPRSKILTGGSNGSIYILLMTMKCVLFQIFLLFLIII